MSPLMLGMDWRGYEESSLVEGRGLLEEAGFCEEAGLFEVVGSLKKLDCYWFYKTFQSGSVLMWFRVVCWWCTERGVDTYNDPMTVRANNTQATL
jgi:hypothetical protein